MSALPSDDTRWFAAEVQPHDAALRGWLRARFPALGDVDDVVQETYTRVLQIRARDPLRQHAVKPLLFTTARNLALDELRRLPQPPGPAMKTVLHTAAQGRNQTIGQGSKPRITQMARIVEGAAAVMRVICVICGQKFCGWRIVSKGDPSASPTDPGSAREGWRASTGRCPVSRRQWANFAPLRSRRRRFFRSAVLQPAWRESRVLRARAEAPRSAKASLCSLDSATVPRCAFSGESPR
jgi:hypothetical protein